MKLATAAPHTQSYEGTLFTACPILNVVILNTRATLSTNAVAPAVAASQPGDYHVIPIPRIQSFQILSLAAVAENGSEATFATAQPAIGPVETRRLKEREAAQIARLKEEERNRGKGVTKEAQAIFDSFRRMYVSHTSAQVAILRLLTDYGIATCPSAGTTKK